MTTALRTRDLLRAVSAATDPADEGAGEAVRWLSHALQRVIATHPGVAGSCEYDAAQAARALGVGS